MDTKDIQKIAHEIIGAEYVRLTAELAFDDLMGLYGDIRKALHGKTSDNLIDTYTELMAKEQGLYFPDAAYEAGKEAAQASCKYKPLKYIGSILLEPENEMLLKERDGLYDTIYNLLGEEHELISDFTEAYRRCHGIISRKIDVFYHLGFYGYMPYEDYAEQIKPA